MKTRGFEKIKNGVVILNTFINEDNARESMESYADCNGYTVKNDCVMDGDKLVVTLFDYAQEESSRDSQEFWDALRSVKDSSYIDYYVVAGSLGLWDGRHGGICETFDSLYDALSKCSKDAYDIVVKYEDNAIKFENHHHDGTNYFEVYNLSYDDYNKIEWWDDDKDGDVFEFIKKHAKPISWEMIGQGAF